MVTKMNKNVLLVQEIPSNLIEEVILILKTEDKKIMAKTREILMTEANEIIQDCSVKLQKEYEANCRRQREEAYRKRRQKNNFLAITGITLFTISIAFLVQYFS